MILPGLPAAAGRCATRQRCEVILVMQTVQLSIADGAYAGAVREALSRTCAWHVKSVDRPDPSSHDVMVLDHQALECLPLPLNNPERIVLVTDKAPELLSEAWEAGIVSVVSHEDPMNTVLLAIMAAGLRVDKPRSSPIEISPSSGSGHAQISPQKRTSRSKYCKFNSLPGCYRWPPTCG